MRNNNGIMIKSCKIIYLLIAFLLILPTLSLGAQCKVTKVYDGATVQAEEYG